MKTNLRFSLLTILTLSVLVLNACGPTASAVQPAGNAQNSQPSPVEFTGAIDTINGNQWVVNGQAVVLDAQAHAAASAFKVGDTVHVKGMVAPDGTVTISGLEDPNAPSAPLPVADSSGGNPPVADASPMPEPTANPQPTILAGPQDLVGMVQAINGNELTIDGIVYFVPAGVVRPADLAVGALVQIKYVTAPGGARSITDIQMGASTGGSAGGSGGGEGSEDDHDEGEDD
jgi:hypothetical protein